MTAQVNKYGLVNTWGPAVGHCNICDSHTKLTEDHVPPKGTLGIPQADLFHIVELLSGQRPIGKKKGRLMQNGVKFRSLCARCNSALLGAQYDPELIKFSNSVHMFLKSAISIPEVASVEIKPGLVARSVLGHLFAIGIERREKTPMLAAAAQFFEDVNLPIPDGMEIYYWVYPYKRQLAVRDGALLTDFFKSPPIVFWCLKYFPLGFMITWDEDVVGRINLPRLRDFMINGGNHPAKVPLIFKPVVEEAWPEAPTENGATFYGSGAFGALPHATRKR